MTDYQHYIAASRYARFLPNEKRRETWSETVTRYVDFFYEKHPDIFPKDEIYQNIYQLNVMPSMRALMTAGKALERDHAAGYNCAYIAIDDPRAFDECMYLLMCGAGVGFSVERQAVGKLPMVSEDFHNTPTEIRVKDSKIGWASALRELIAMLYSGQIPSWDLSAVRPAGSPLKTFGGRSSGPGPLDELFKNVVRIFKNAAGRRLQSIECSDIMNHIGATVVVGGVRRSAQISLSNLSDDRMRNAKTGQWWVDNAQRALANFSAAYTEKPEIGIFMQEWKSLYDSKSGERGIFNRAGAITKMKKLGRRDYQKYEHMYGGSNPCCVSGDMLICTNQGNKFVKDLVDIPFSFTLNNTTYSSNGFWFTGEKPVYKITTSRGYSVTATEDHRIMLSDNTWIPLGDLEIGDTLKLYHQDSNDIIIDSNQFDKGWIIGEVWGDGGHNPDKYNTYVCFWGDNKEFLSDLSYSIISKFDVNYNSPIKSRGPVYNKRNNTLLVQKKALTEFITPYLSKKTKNILPKLETENLSLIAGFISGVFDADGTITGNLSNGIQLQLSQSKFDDLQKIQQMLLCFGIVSSIRKMNNKLCSMLPDGKGGRKEYNIKPQYRLDISRDCVEIFAKYIGFKDPTKSKKLIDLCSAKIKTPYSSRYESMVTNIEYIGIVPVYDCNVPEIELFSCNGIIVHNCEIFLRSAGFCNLTEVVIRPTDTLDDLLKKVEIATIMGTFQSSLSNFRYLRTIWKKNTEEERLLGVSLTGIMDHSILSKVSTEAINWLETMKSHAINTNKIWAEKLNINQSVAVTTTKPSGTVSQLVDSSSGIHPRYAHHYIRTVRSDKLDPIGMFLKDQGIPCENDITKPEKTWVFSFPIKSPPYSRIASEITAIEQLEHYLMFYRHWAEHTVSITVYVREHEWLDVGAWVYSHFDEIGGISFLPYSDHIYQQAPYQPISEEKYNELLQTIPKVQWDQFNVDEHEDKTEGAQQYACSGGMCELI